MTKVLVLTEKPFAAEAVKEIRKIVEEAGLKYASLEKCTEKSDILHAVKDADALIIRSDKVAEDIFEAASNLKIVVRAGAGYDNVDLNTASAKNIVVMNTPGQNSNAVAELALGMMLFQARTQFDGKSGFELRGKKLGIHAFGNVGRYVAKIAKGFGMEVYAFDPFVQDKEIEANGIKVCHSAEELYSTCQYVSLHIPANDKTKKSINYNLLNRMPKGATLVNTARKEVVDENDLLKIFEDRTDFMYLSDVAPECKEEIAREFKNRFFFTPKKMGAQTAEANMNAGVAAAQQIVEFFKDGNMRFKVN